MTSRALRCRWSIKPLPTVSQSPTGPSACCSATPIRSASQASEMSRPPMPGWTRWRKLCTWPPSTAPEIRKPSRSRITSISPSSRSGSTAGPGRSLQAREFLRSPPEAGFDLTGAAPQRSIVLPPLGFNVGIALVFGFFALILFFMGLSGLQRQTGRTPPAHSLGIDRDYSSAGAVLSLAHPGCELHSVPW